MRKLVILVALTAFCAATPLHSSEQNESKEHVFSVPLQRPSPISPDVPSDPKPTERVIKITDPKEVAKYKREAADEAHEQSAPLMPTVQPHTHSSEQESHESHESHEDAAAAVPHNRQKRDQKVADAAGKEPTLAAKNAIKKDNPSVPKQVSGSSTPVPANTKKTTPTPDTQKHRQRREVQSSTTAAAVPLIHRDEVKQPPPLGHGLPHQTADSQNQQHTPVLGSAQTLPAHLPASRPVKRDIPVPLVPKYQHPEESPKLGGKQDDKKADDKKTEKDSDESVESDEDKPSAEHKRSGDSKEHSNESHHPVAPSHTTEHHSRFPQQAHNPHDFHPQQPHVDQHPVVEQTNDAVATSTSSTEHPVIRQKPVPVAELFSRPRQ